MIATLPTTLPETNTPPARKPSQKERSVFQPSNFRCKLAVSFTDGNLLVVETTAPLARVSGRSFVGGWMELCATTCAKAFPARGMISRSGAGEGGFQEPSEKSSYKMSPWILRCFKNSYGSLGVCHPSPPENKALWSRIIKGTMMGLKKSPLKTALNLLSPCHSVEVNATLNKCSPQQIQYQPEDQHFETKVEAGGNGWRKWPQLPSSTWSRLGRLNMDRSSDPHQNFWSPEKNSDPSHIAWN